MYFLILLILMFASEQFPNPTASELLKSRNIIGVVWEIFLCTGKNASCCDNQVALETWHLLKALCQDFNATERHKIARTQATCLRLCEFGGPNLKIIPGDSWSNYFTEYPGVWVYKGVKPHILDNLILSHIKELSPMQENLLYSELEQKYGGAVNLKDLAIV